MYQLEDGEEDEAVEASTEVEVVVVGVDEEG